MAGIVGAYNTVPRIDTRTATFKSTSDGVTNPVDTSPQQISNIRGQLTINIFQSDNPPGVFSTFSVTGGFGEWPDEYTRNWYSSPNGIFCSVVEPSLNTFEVTTSAPAVARTYRFVFFYNLSQGPTIQKIGGADLGAANLVVTLSKNFIIEGF